MGSVLSGEPSCGGAFAEQSTWGQDDGRPVCRLVGRLDGRLVGPFMVIGHGDDSSAGHWHGQQ